MGWSYKMKFANKVKTKPHLAVNKQTTEKERELEDEAPKKTFQSNALYCGYKCD